VESSRPDAVLIVNTQSRRGERLYAKAKHAMVRRGIGIAESYPVRDASRIPAVVAEAVAQGHRFIVVGGGDGTVSSAVSSLVDHEVALGLLPMGTANNFARANGIPLDLAKAVELLATGRTARVDLGFVERTAFTNAVSIGITGAIHRGSPDGLKRRFGRIGYLIAATRQAAAFRPFRCRLVLDGVPLETDAIDIRVANGPFQGGVRVLAEARVDSGALVARVIRAHSSFALARVWMRAGMGRAADPDLVQTYTARTIALSAAPLQDVSVDGEVVTRTPVEIRVDPGALALVVPRPGPQSFR
jgi:YegS/Rv2252/BmrU family lipid kinase